MYNAAMTDRKQHRQGKEALADSILGTWSPQWSIGDGEPTTADDLRNITLTFVDGRCEVRRGESLIRLGTYTTDTTTSPPTLDVSFTASDVPELIDAPLRGIYQISSGRLRICYGPPGRRRAESFCGDKGTEQYLAEYRRNHPPG
jgi:uncharacterized protein (TIGR03067 family)